VCPRSGWKRLAGPAAGKAAAQRLDLEGEWAATPGIRAADEESAAGGKSCCPVVTAWPG